MADTPDDRTPAERAAEEFRQRWGFDPRPLIDQITRDGGWDVEGGTEDEREFIRAVLAGKRGLPATAPTPRCPLCGHPPLMLLPSDTQAFCGNDDCTLICWNPSVSLDENLLDAGVIHLPEERTDD